MICCRKNISEYYQIRLLLLPWIIGLLATIWQPVYAQEINLQGFSDDEGLPSSEVHDLYQDSLGRIWMATDNGLAVFNGNSFRIFNLDSGLPSNVIFNFFREREDQVWISTRENHLYAFNPVEEKPSFVGYPYNDSIVEAFKLAIADQYIRRISRLSGSQISLSFLSGVGKIVVSLNGSYQLIGQAIKKDQIDLYRFNRHFDCDIVVNLDMRTQEIYASFQLDTLTPSEIWISDAKSQKRTLVSTNYEMVRSFQYGVSDAIFIQDQVLFTLGIFLVNYNQTSGHVEVMKMPSEILRLVKHEDKFWVATFNGCFLLDQELMILDQVLTGFIITDVLIDDVGGIWLSTVQDGVFYSRNPKIKSFNLNQEKNHIFQWVKVRKDYQIGITLDNELLMMKRDGTILRSLPLVSEINNNIQTENGDDLSGLVGREMFRSEDLVMSGKRRVFSLDFDANDDTKNFSADNNSISGGNQFEMQSAVLDIPKMNDNLLVNDSLILITTEKGLYTLSHFSTVDKFSSDSPLSEVYMREIERFREGYLITTYQDGLLYLKDGSFKQLSENHGLISNDIKHLHVSSDHLVWVGTDKGLNRISLGEKIDEPEISHFSTLNGLPGNVITCLDSFNDTLWVGTKKGLCLFSEYIVIDSEPLPSAFLCVDSVKVNRDRKFFQGDHLELNESDLLEMFFTQTVFSYTQSINYEYRVKELNAEWTGSDGYIAISNLPPGKFTLEIRSLADNIASRESKIITLTVVPTFWKSWWFILIIVLLTVGAIYLIVIFFIKRNDLIRRREYDLLNLEIKALLAQMNPHFTFNTINSIQHYIIKKEKLEALNYLSEFATLIRRTLEFSRKETVSLMAEIEFLEIYTRLEQRRFDKPFDFEVELMLETIPENIKFPPLMLQPFVENSIIHGISRIEGEGLIRLKIVEFPDYFELSISDNGVGMQKKDKIEKKDSYGLEIVRQRLKIYNGKNYSHSDLRYYSNTDGKQGTSVTLILRKY